MSTTMVPLGALVGPSDRAQAALRQRQDALQSALMAKRGRRVLLDRLHACSPAASCEMAAEMLCDPPEVMANLPLLTILGSVRRLPEKGAEKMCEIAGIFDSPKLGEISAEQRAVLAALLRMRATTAKSSDAGGGTTGRFGR